MFNTLQVYLGSLYVNDFNLFGRTWQVNVQADRNFREQIEDLKQLKVRNDAGKWCRSDLLDGARVTGPVLDRAYNMYSAAPINCSPAPGVSSGQAIELMQKAWSRTNCLVDALRMDRAGAVAIANRQHGHARILAGRGAGVPGAGRAVRKLVAAAGGDSGRADVLAVLGRGGAVREHGRQHLHAGGLRRADGLACKNAILIVEFARAQREAGKDRYDATLEACKLRLRPIVMTSFAFILGVVPLVLSVGAGAEMRRTLGTAVFGGMLGVTLFGIFLTPVFYYVIEWIDDYWRRPVQAAGGSRALDPLAPKAANRGGADSQVAQDWPERRTTDFDSHLSSITRGRGMQRSRGVRPVFAALS